MATEADFNHEDVYPDRGDEFFDDETTIREKTIEPVHDEAEIEELTAALINSQAINGRLDMENKFLMLRLRHQLKESEANAKKAQAKVLKLQEDIAQLMKVSKYQQNAVELEKKAAKEAKSKADSETALNEHLTATVNNLKWGFQSREASLKHKLDEHKRAVVKLHTSEVDTRDVLRGICESVCEELSAIDNLILIEEEVQRHAFEEEQGLLHEVQELQSKLSDLRRLHDAVCEEKQLIEEHYEELEKEVEETSKVLSQMQNKHALEITQLTKQFHEGMAALTSQVMLTDEQHSAVEAKVHEFSAQNGELIEQLETATERIRLLEGQNQELTERYSNLEADVANQSKSAVTEEVISDIAARHDAEIEILKQQNAEEIAKQEGHIAELEKFIIESKEYNKQQIEALEMRLQQLDEENEGLLEYNAEATERQEQALLDQKQKDEAIICDLREQIACLQASNPDKDESAAQNDASIVEDLEAQLDRVQREALLNAAAKDAQINELKAKVSTLITFMEKQTSEGEGKLRSQISSLQSEKMKLLSTHELQVAEIKTLQERIDETVESMRREGNQQLLDASEQHRQANDKLKLFYENRIVELEAKLAMLLEAKESEKVELDEQITRLKVNAVIDKNEFERQLEDHAGIVDRLVSQRERREQEFVAEKETLRARYKRNEELYDSNVKQLSARLAEQEQEFAAEREIMSQRTLKHDEELARLREEFSLREKGLEAEFKKSSDDLRNRELNREQELTAVIDGLKEKLNSAENNYLEDKLKMIADDKQREIVWQNKCAALENRIQELTQAHAIEISEVDIKLKSLRGEHVPVIEERLSMLSADNDTKAFNIVEMTGTIVALWQRITELEAEVSVKSKKLGFAEAQMETMKSQIGEMELAIDSAEEILSESAILQEKLRKSETLRIEFEERFGRSNRELLLRDNADEELFNNIDALRLDVHRKILHLADEVADNTLGNKENNPSFGQQVNGVLTTSKSALGATTPMSSLNSFNPANTIHSEPMTSPIHAFPSLMGMTMAIKDHDLNSPGDDNDERFDNTSSSGADAVDVFNTHLRFMMSHLQSVAFIQRTLGNEELLQLCAGVASPLRKTKCSQRIRQALQKIVLPKANESDVRTGPIPFSTKSQASIPDKRFDYVSNSIDNLSTMFDESRTGHLIDGARLNNRHDDVHSVGSSSQPQSRSGDNPMRVILRKPVDKTIGKRSLVVPGQSPVPHTMTGVSASSSSSRDQGLTNRPRSSSAGPTARRQARIHGFTTARSTDDNCASPNKIAADKEHSALRPRTSVSGVAKSKVQLERDELAEKLLLQHELSQQEKIADNEFAAEMSDSYKLLLESLLHIEKDSEQALAKSVADILAFDDAQAKVSLPNPNGDINKDTPDALTELAFVLAQGTASTKQSTSNPQPPASKKSSAIFATTNGSIAIPVKLLGVAEVPCVDIFGVFTAMERTVQESIGVVENFNKGLCTELHSMEYQLSEQYQQLESIGNLIKSQRLADSHVRALEAPKPDKVAVASKSGTLPSFTSIPPNALLEESLPPSMTTGSKVETTAVEISSASLKATPGRPTSTAAFGSSTASSRTPNQRSKSPSSSSANRTRGNTFGYSSTGVSSTPHSRIVLG